MNNQATTEQSDGGLIWHFTERGCVAETNRSTSECRTVLNHPTRRSLRSGCGWSSTQPRSGQVMSLPGKVGLGFLSLLCSFVVKL